MKTLREPLIRLFEDVASSVPPVKIDALTDRQGVKHAALLLQKGYLKGAVDNDENGLPRSVTVLGITLDGHVYLDKLHEDARNRTPLGRLVNTGIKVIPWLAGAVVGVFLTILTQYLLKRFGLD